VNVGRRGPPAANLVAFERMNGAQLASIQVSEHKARRRSYVPTRGTKAFESAPSAK